MNWPAEIFWARVDVRGPDECWPWRKAVTSAGYGHMRPPDAPRRANKTVLAHRLAYEIANGAIGENLVVDHLCENTLCCNPAHLEAVTQATNLERAVGKRTHCRHGHPLDGLRRNTDKYGPRISRYCKTCSNARGRRRRAELQAAGLLPKGW